MTQTIHPSAVPEILAALKAGEPFEFADEDRSISVTPEGDDVFRVATKRKVERLSDVEVLLRRYHA